MCGAGSSRIAATTRATSTDETGEVLPAPIGSASSLASRTLAAARSRKKPSQEPGNPPLSCFGHHLFQPQRLLVLLRFAAAHQHHVESDKTPRIARAWGHL